MKKYLKTLLTIIAIPMLVLAVAPNAMAGPSAQCEVSFEIKNPNEFGIAIEWIEEPGGPYYDFGSQLYWFDDVDHDVAYLWTPISEFLAKDRSLWSWAKAGNVWEMNTGSSASFPLFANGLRRAGAGVEGNIYGPSGHFVALESGVMVIELAYRFAARLRVDSWAQHAEASGAIDIYFENEITGARADRHLNFDIDLARTASQNYLDEDTILIKLPFEAGQTGYLDWMFTNDSKVQRYQLRPFTE